jgi:hypothetical protein
MERLSCLVSNSRGDGPHGWPEMGRARVARGSGVPVSTPPPDIPNPPASGFGPVGFERPAGF